jgi:hypothetical protein
MKQIVLEKDWGRHKAKTTLDVLGPGDELKPQAVDATRAAALVAAGFAVDPSAEKPATSKPTKAPARKG